MLIRGGVRIEEGANPKLTVNDIIPLEDAKVPLPRSLRIRIPLETASEGTVDALHTLFRERKGEAKVLFDVERQGDFMVVMEAEGYNVDARPQFHCAAWRNCAGAARCESSTELPAVKQFRMHIQQMKTPDQEFNAHERTRQPWPMTRWS